MKVKKWHEILKILVVMIDKVRVLSAKHLMAVLSCACFIVLGCVGGGDKKEIDNKEVSASKKTESSAVDPLSNKGIGPITSVTLGKIDPDLVSKGKDVYERMCTACHKASKKYIGPSPQGILKRRSPEWIMNMILNPEEMSKNDPIAKELLIKFNGMPMANQNLTEKEARAILEYFRTLE